MKKLGVITVGLSVIGIFSFGLNHFSETQQATHADHFITKPDLAYSVSDTPVYSYVDGNTEVSASE
ncbi:Phr family secreted Rap phosphatase inhibitor [Bacillus arachidis]|uniref:Phr family secreted Rap phosphatase inhibitor n=1 Tax=Bacillus arachidis TaxID=2819290 RepID=UPI00255CBA81|nr:Phr family secreted Rap phosphatase inhibitor [Bacillus arachidis]WIY62226.1 Phr family secreted Rap phosphatase inhibitor [Bacillus arachidis]